jgi:hypothetical protein
MMSDSWTWISKTPESGSGQSPYSPLVGGCVAPTVRAHAKAAARAPADPCAGLKRAVASADLVGVRGLIPYVPSEDTIVLRKGTDDPLNGRLESRVLRAIPERFRAWALQRGCSEAADLHSRRSCFQLIVRTAIVAVQHRNTQVPNRLSTGHALSARLKWRIQTRP